ncbi:uncharacterized protein LOC141837285 [Curcuma longa]|uniref:uncharacterized protein LOC141837285 n=1 Tax=Curcuma longa TaxID=136217 RepID=UPI003D9F8793
MAILKDDSRVSRRDNKSSPVSRGSGSIQETEEEACTRSAKVGSYASEFSDVDSGMESDEFDPAELGEPGTQLCQVGNQSFSVPLELYDLSGLGTVLSLETWNECLSEDERFLLAEFLPDMDQETFGHTLKELFSRENFHFGSPLDTLFIQLKGGLCDPRIVLYRRGLSLLQRHEYYHHLCKYHNSMVRTLVRTRDAWRKCSGYAIEERLRLLNILRSQRPLSYVGNDDVGYEMDSESGDSDNSHLNKRFKIGQQFVKPAFAIMPHEIGMTYQSVKDTKEYSKGVLKVALSKGLAQECVGSSHGYPSALKHGSKQNKFAGYDVKASKRIRDHISNNHDDREEEYVASQGDWAARNNHAVARTNMLISGKKQGQQKRYDTDIHNDEDPEIDNNFSQGCGGKCNSGQAITAYIHDSSEHTKAKYFDRVWVYPSTRGDRKHKLTDSMQLNEIHEEAISLSYSAKSDRIGKEYRAGKSGAGHELKNKSYNHSLVQMVNSHIQKDSRSRISQGRMKKNETQYENKGVTYLRDSRMISGSEETESDSSEQVEDDRFPIATRKSNKVMKGDKKAYASFPDVNKSGHTPVSNSVKGMNGEPMKQALLQHPTAKLTNAEKRHKAMADTHHSPEQSLYADDYGSGVMDEHKESLHGMPKSRGSKKLINKLVNMMEVSDSPRIDAAQERSDMPLIGCNFLSKKSKLKVNAHLLSEQDESVHLQDSPKLQVDDHIVTRKGRRKIDAEIEMLNDINPDLVTSGKVSGDGEGKAKSQKKPFTLITPTIHTGFSFSIVHLLSAVRKAMITPLIEDTALIASHLHDNNGLKIFTDGQHNVHQIATDIHISQSFENMGKHSIGSVENSGFLSLTVQEIVDRVRLNPGDPYILETQEPLHDLVRGVLKIFSSKTAPLGAKGWKPFVSYEKSNKSWSWAGPVASTSHNDNGEEETSADAWGIPHKMLVKLVDAFANWLKSSQITLQQIGSLPPPPASLLLNMDEKARFKDLRAQKSLNTISPSSDEVRAYFHREELLRYSIPDRAFSYTAADGKKSIVAPLRRGGGKPTSKARDHFMLKPDRPPHVTILCLVRDAAARLPGRIGTRADVCTLLRDSQYVVENISDAQVNQVVSGALDRLHYERDPCVQFDSERKLWVYLHRDREEEDFEDDGTSSTKKWKRQRKDSLDQSDMGPVNDVDGAALVGGSSVGLDDEHDFNVLTSPIRAGGVAEVSSEDVGLNIDNTNAFIDSTIIKKDHDNWGGLGLDPLRERLVCQENSTDDFDDGTFSQEGPISLQYDLIMKNRLY